MKRAPPTLVGRYARLHPLRIRFKLKWCQSRGWWLYLKIIDQHRRCLPHHQLHEAVSTTVPQNPLAHTLRAGNLELCLVPGGSTTPSPPTNALGILMSWQCLEIYLKDNQKHKLCLENSYAEMRLETLESDVPRFNNLSSMASSFLPQSLGSKDTIDLFYWEKTPLSLPPYSLC